MAHDNTYGPLPRPSDELLDLLRRIADHDDAPDAVQADARDYLQFGGVTFSGDARFDRAIFSRTAGFFGATFSGDAQFDSATFSGEPLSDGAALFIRATFSRNAQFGGTTFSGTAWFSEATFAGTAGFVGTTFDSTALFDGVRVLHLDDPDSSKGDENAHGVWPEGWTVQPDADDPSRGTLVPSATGAN